METVSTAATCPSVRTLFICLSEKKMDVPQFKKTRVELTRQNQRTQQLAIRMRPFNTSHTSNHSPKLKIDSHWMRHALCPIGDAAPIDPGQVNGLHTLINRWPPIDSQTIIRAGLEFFFILIKCGSITTVGTWGIWLNTGLKFNKALESLPSVRTSKAEQKPQVQTASLRVNTISRVFQRAVPDH